MGGIPSLDDYTTLPGKSGCDTLWIRVWIGLVWIGFGVTPVRAQNSPNSFYDAMAAYAWVSSLPGRPNHPRIQSSNAENWSPGSRGCQAPLEVCSPCAWAMCFDASDSEVAAVVVAVGHAMRPRKTGLTRL